MFSSSLFVSIIVVLLVFSLGGTFGCTNKMAAFDGKEVDGHFTTYDIGGKGQCGWDTGTQEYSASGSDQFFDKSCPWTDPSEGNTNTDPMCTNKYCAWICYKGKQIDVPINNMFGEGAPPDHLDLSPKAAEYLGAPRTDAKGAKFVYHLCNTTVTKTCSA